MSVSPLQRRSALAALFNFPKSLRDDVVELPGFKMAFDIPAEAEISFDAIGLRFLRSSLFTALRELHGDPNGTRSLDTEDNRACSLRLDRTGDHPLISCQTDGETHELPAFAMLSPSADDRVSEFDRLAARDNLFDAQSMAWRRLLQEGPLSDEMVSRALRELDQNPLRLRQKIREAVEGGQAAITTTVPDSAAYYDRLIGSLDDAHELNEFVENSCRSHIDRTMERDFAVGLSFSLLCAGHPTITDLIDVGTPSQDDLAQAFGWLAERGDRFSQIAGVELGVRLVARYPEIEPSLVRMVVEMRDEDTAATNSRFALSSSLFILVDGELSRRGTLNGKPPFWRRLAAMAQSSLFERELIRADLDVEKFMEWATLGRGSDFFVQALADLRIEPRWLPDFMSPDRLKDAAISRMVGAGEKLTEDAKSLTLRELLKGDGNDGLRSRIRYPQSFLPGPLEGNILPQQDLPPDLIEDLTSAVGSPLLNASALAGLVNSALVFRIGDEHSKLASEALRKARHQVSVSHDSGDTFSVLTGLATVAAVTRDVDLAKEVRILARVVRRRTGSALDVADLMRIGLAASAAHVDVEGWSQSVGEWFLEIAYEEMTIERAIRLRAHLRKLCAIVPELWRHCGMADASFAAVSQRS